ncbi:MAG: cytochrome c [Deltaproteobacteria bacterium]|nr:cytochrome c [Deltaproteobacteria bacterium]
MKYISTVVIVLALMGLGAIIYAWSGAYNIAATEPHWDMTASFIELLRDRSIAVHSSDIQAPNLDDPKLKEVGVLHYHEMCRLCHGAPGYRREEFAEGLYPSPPSMTSGSLQSELGKAEIYWIVRHGVKLTGMPAFGPTHTEEQLWGLVAFVEDVPRTAPEQYRQMVMKEGGMGPGHGHGETSEEETQVHGHSEPSDHGKAEEQRQ